MPEPCHICGESCLENFWKCPKKARNANFICCHDCLRGYVKGRVEQGYSKMRCPCHECDYVFQDELLPLLSPKTAEHLGNLRLLNSSPLAVRCPKCKVVSKGDPRRPHMECPTCTTQFCFHHGIDHPPGKCPRKRTRWRPLGRAKSWLWKKLRTRKCDHCGFRIERDGGCSLMTCRCGHTFCWHCKSPTAETGHRWIIYPTLQFSIEQPICNSWKIWACRVAGFPMIFAAGVVLIGIAVVVYPQWQLFRKLGLLVKKWRRARVGSTPADVSQEPTDEDVDYELQTNSRGRLCVVMTYEGESYVEDLADMEYLKISHI